MAAHNLIERTQVFYELLFSDFAIVQSDYLATNFAWENPLPDNIPFGGTYQGAEGLLRYLTEINTAIELSPLQFTDLIANDSVVAAVGVEEDTLVRSTGRRYTMPFVHVLRFETDGKISHVREYNDTREMVAAFNV
jgi:ketosteroid isomerase-like protein